MMKHFFLLFTALIATTALWAADFEVDGIAYNKLGGDSVEVTFKSPNYTGDITILATITYSSTTYRVTSIGDSAFYGSSLTSITLPNSVVSIGNKAFQCCSFLTSVTIQNGITSIGKNAFYGCFRLISLTIPSSVSYIGELVFLECTALSSINVDTANTHYASTNGVLFNFAKDTLIQYPSNNTRTTYTIPNSVTRIEGWAFSYSSHLVSITIGSYVTSIGDNAFLGCDSLTSLTIPNSVTSIGSSAFESCTSLSYITCNATTPPTCGEYCFDDMDKSIPLYVPAESISAYQTANEWKDFTNIQAITTDLHQLTDSEFKIQNSKFIHNGQLLILREGKTYNAQGGEL